MTISPRVIEWVSDVGDPFEFVGDKGEPVRLWPVYAKTSNDEILQIFKRSEDAATEVQGILVEHVDKDLFLDLEDTGKLSKKGNKKFKLFQILSPSGDSIDLRKVGTSGAVETPPATDTAAGPPSNSAPAPDSSSEGQGVGEAPAPSTSKWADKPAPADWGIE